MKIKCEHKVFPKKGAMRECKHIASWWFNYDYGVSVIKGRVHKGKTALCTQHYKAQLAETDADREVIGNKIQDPFEKIK